MGWKIYGSAVVFLLGLVVGSFDNVAIYRIPEGLSLWSPRSFCPACRSRIAWFDNIPLLSYLLLRGKCRCCGEPISPRYPLVELASGLLFLAVFAAAGFGWRDDFYSWPSSPGCASSGGQSSSPTSSWPPCSSSSPA